MASREQGRDESESGVRRTSMDPSGALFMQDNRADASAPRAADGVRIVVVDDHVDTAMMMSALLRLAGHEVEAAHDGQAAVLAVERFKPDVVLLDLGLPDMDGCEIARRLRQTPAGKDVLLIALTGYTQAEHVAATRQAGFDHHLTKPVDLSSVRRLIACAPRSTRA